MTFKIGQTVRVKQDWVDAGRIGTVLAVTKLGLGQTWVGILWVDEEDPDWFKAAGLEAVGAG